MQRVKVSGPDCRQYVIQNNNSGNSADTTQVIEFVGNSFTIKSSTASSSSGSSIAPASFPSIYIGGNGNIANGAYLTWDNSGLPKRVSSIASIQTSFTWSGGTTGGDYNAIYDVWFAKSASTVAGSYTDGISGFLQVWFYKPDGRDPNGSTVRSSTISGHNWDVWVGKRGNTIAGTDGPDRPVVSYVAQDAPLSSLSFDLIEFIKDAVSNGAADKSAGKTSQAFSSSWYLTDVFAGFEIWTGSDATDLHDKFECVVK